MTQHIIEITTYEADKCGGEALANYYGISESREAGVLAWAKKSGYTLTANDSDVYPTGDHCRSEYLATPIETGFPAFFAAKPLRVTVGDVKQSF